MPEFTNEVIEIDLLPKYQEVNLITPHPHYWRVILINISIFILLGILGLSLFVFFNEKARLYSVYFFSGFVFAFGLIFLLFRASFKKRGYALREKDIVYKSGIIAETTSIIPLNRIQHVALEEGMISRRYMLATLQIYTAGGTSGHMHISGIPIDQAKTIKEALLKKLDLLGNSTD